MQLCCFCRYGVTGYPTLKFFPKSNKAGEDYDAGRDLDDFVNFINEKSGTSRDGKGQLTSKVSEISIFVRGSQYNVFYFLDQFYIS
jgi:hypothetical protein